MNANEAPTPEADHLSPEGKPLLVVGLMTAARGLLFPLLWAANRLGRGDCLLAVAQAPAREGD